MYFIDKLKYMYLLYAYFICIYFRLSREARSADFTTRLIKSLEDGIAEISKNPLELIVEDLLENVVEKVIEEMVVIDPFNENIEEKKR